MALATWLLTGLRLSQRALRRCRLVVGWPLLLLGQLRQDLAARRQQIRGYGCRPVAVQLCLLALCVVARARASQWRASACATHGDRAAVVATLLLATTAAAATTITCRQIRYC